MELLAAYVVAILCAARLTRLVAFDDWPPSIWFRGKWEQLTPRVKTDGNALIEHPWRKLVTCPYCLAPWLLLPVLGVAWVVVAPPPGDTVLEQVWWFVAAWLGGSYAASIVVIYDGDD